MPKKLHSFTTILYRLPATNNDEGIDDELLMEKSDVSNEAISAASLLFSVLELTKNVTLDHSRPPLRVLSDPGGGDHL